MIGNKSLSNLLPELESWHLDCVFSTCSTYLTIISWKIAI